MTTIKRSFLNVYEAVIFNCSRHCQKIAKIQGIGPKTATALIAAIGDGSDFKNGRHLAA
jgi:transposase